MTLDEALLAQGGTKRIYIPHLLVYGYMSMLEDDEDRAEVFYRLEKGGRIYENIFFLDQLKLDKE